MRTRRPLLQIALIVTFLTTAVFTSCTKEVPETSSYTTNTISAATARHLQLLQAAGNDIPAAVVQNAHADRKSGGQGNPSVFPPNAHMHGRSYSAWTAAWWEWSFEFPIAGHPFIDDAGFDASAGQTGNVWFLGTPFGTVVRDITVPEGKALLVGMLNGAAADLGGLSYTYAELLEGVNWYADHIIGLTATIDGMPVHNIGAYRFVSPQFSFTAPDPWIFSPDPSGAYIAVADGYFLMVKPLAVGPHVIHYSGAFHFTLAEDGFDFHADIDMTYNVLVN